MLEAGGGPRRAPVAPEPVHVSHPLIAGDAGWTAASMSSGGLSTTQSVSLGPRWCLVS